MLNLIKTEENGKIRLALEGRLDTYSAPELEKELQGLLPDTNALTMDFAGLDYISSAGLRVLLMAQKSLGKRGTLKICNVNEPIMEIFEVTGFAEILSFP